MASEKTLEVPRDIGKTNSNNSNLCKTSKMVGVPFKYYERVPPPSLRAQSVSVHRCFNQRLGSSSRGPKNPGHLVRSREDTPCQSTRAQSCILGSKTLRARVNTKSRLDLFRQLFSGSLPEQTRRHKVMGNDPNDMEDLLLDQPQRNPGPVPTRPRFTQRDCRLLVKGRQDHPDRMVPTPCSFPANMSDLASARGRHVCNLPQSQAQKVHFTNPRPKGLEGGLFEPTLGPARRICLLPHRHPPSTGPKDVDLSVSNDCDSSRVARDGLVLGPHRALNQATTQTTPVEVPVETASQQVPSQEPGISQSSCLESGFQERQTPRFSSSVETRVKAPQRKSSRAVYTARWTIFRTWCTENQVDVSLSPIPSIADFLLYLFEQKGLKPSTIAGYRTAIADGLGPEGEAVSTIRELNRLLASFHRDRPRSSRSIPSWDLSLVLLALTRQPFEPLRTTDLKLLTFKTVFLLALASGKRRAEIHAWLESSVFFKADGSKVTLAPSPAFLAKNQLASEGPDSIQPVVIPALAPGLDLDLIEDRSLCPVRALRIYLDRTKGLRKDKTYCLYPSRRVTPKISLDPQYQIGLKRLSNLHTKTQIMRFYRSLTSKPMT